MKSFRNFIGEKLEEFNYEEWVEESNDYHYMVGDRVKILSSECNNFVSPMIGTTGVVVGMLTGKGRYAVKFDTTNKEVLDYLIENDDNGNLSEQIRKSFEFFGTHNMYFFILEN